jgi:hypothetical protein
MQIPLSNAGRRRARPSGPITSYFSASCVSCWACRRPSRKRPIPATTFTFSRKRSRCPTAAPALLTGLLCPGSQTGQRPARRGSGPLFGGRTAGTAAAQTRHGRARHRCLGHGHGKGAAAGPAIGDRLGLYTNNNQWNRRVTSTMTQNIMQFTFIIGNTAGHLTLHDFSW